MPKPLNLSALMFAAIVSLFLPFMSNSEELPALRKFTLHVVDASSGKAVSGAPLKVEMKVEGAEKKTYDAVTDDSGSFRVDIPEGLKEFYVNVLFPSYIHSQFRWLFDSKKPDRKFPPEEYTLKMVTGSLIGGKVVKTDGKPLEAVTVSLQIYGYKWNEYDHLLGDSDVRTDAEGNWSLRVATEKIFMINIWYTHNDIAIGATEHIYLPICKPVLDILKERKHLFRVEEGLLQEGVILDEKENPVANVGIYVSTKPALNMKSSADGSFCFKIYRKQGYGILFFKDGYAPEVKSISSSENSLPYMKVKLGKGVEVKGRLVDPEGNPLKHFKIKRDLNIGEVSKPLACNTETDDDGYFVVRNVPESQTVQFTVLSTEKFMGRHFDLSATMEEPVVVVPRNIPIRLEVEDADTGVKIDKFANRLSYFNMTHSRYCEKGPAEYDFDWMYENMDKPFELSVEILAKDYPVTKQTRKILLGDKTQIFKFQLSQKGAKRGIVLTPDGQPANKARIFFYKENQHGAESPSLSEFRSALTDWIEAADDGRYIFFPAPENPDMVAIIHKEGYAEYSFNDFAGLDKVELKKMGKLEGVVIKNEKPVPVSDIRISKYVFIGDGRKIFSMARTKTDEKGHFLINDVPDGYYEVSWDSENIASFVKCSSGNVTFLTLGTVGCTVTGKIAPPVGVSVNFLSDRSIRCYCSLDPGNDKNFWKLKTPRTENEMKEAIAKKLRYGYKMEFLPDGSFTIYDVVSGNYKIDFTCYKDDEDMTRLGSREFKFSVTEKNMKGLSLGVIRIEPEGLPEN